MELIIHLTIHTKIHQLALDMVMELFSKQSIVETLIQRSKLKLNQQSIVFHYKHLTYYIWSNSIPFYPYAKK